jgi:hypothetical protein
MNTNHWQIGKMPLIHYRSNLSGKWSHGDNLTNFEKNPNKDFWNDIDISYVYNKQGFRCPDFEQFLGKKVNLALGCSFTEGIGLPIDRAWPGLIEKKLEYPLLNLGLAGSSADTVARILTNSSTLFDIQTVFILWPMTNRFELYHIDINMSQAIDHILPGRSKIEHTWALEEEMCTQRYYKNHLLVNQLANNYDFRVKQFTLLETIEKCRPDPKFQDADRARDGMHWGFRTHELVSEMFLNA